MTEVFAVLVWQDRDPAGSVESIWTTRGAADERAVSVLEAPMMADDCHANVVPYLLNTAWGATAARTTT